MKKIIYSALLLAISCMPVSLYAEALLPIMTERLSVPVDCDFSKNCFVQYNFEHKDMSGQGLTWKKQNTLKYKGSTYTWFRNIGDKSIPVLAAADGVVVAKNGSRRKFDFSEPGSKLASSRSDMGFLDEYIEILHEDGTVTIYGTLEKNSIHPEVGDRVSRGEEIARTGNSTYTNFNGLAFQVLRHRVPIDPFAHNFRYNYYESKYTTVWSGEAIDDLLETPFMAWKVGDIFHVGGIEKNDIFYIRSYTKDNNNLIEYKRNPKRAYNHLQWTLRPPNREHIDTTLLENDRWEFVWKREGKIILSGDGLIDEENRIFRP